MTECIRRIVGLLIIIESIHLTPNFQFNERVTVYRSFTTTGVDSGVWIEYGVTDNVRESVVC